MRTSYFKLVMLLIVLFCQIQTIIFAQKPVPKHSLEILPNEVQETSYHEYLQRTSLETGLPLALYGEQFLVSGNNPTEMGLDYLYKNKIKLGLTKNEIDNLSHHATRVGLTGTTVRFRQYYKQLPVNEAEITIKIDNRNRVRFVMNGFRYNVSLENVSPQILPSNALELAKTYLGVTQDLNFEETILMIYNNRLDSRLAYRIRMEPKHPLGDWMVYIDAITGDIFKVKDNSCYYGNKKHVHSKKKPKPQALFNNFLNDWTSLATGSGNVFAPHPLASATTVYGGNYSDNNDANNSALEAELENHSLLDISFSGGNYSLVGPFAEIVDFENPFNGLYQQSSANFDYNRQQDAFEAVNCYYHIDLSMRYLNNTLGVSVAPYHYSGGARFDPHGINGADNSYYLGGSGRISFGEGGVDDAEDVDVILHELGHALHDWITFGGLSQVNGLSEGIGDYWAASYHRSLGYWTPADDEYYWIFGWDGHNPFWNGRINNYTGVYPDDLVGGVHTDGQIWSTACINAYEQIGRTKMDKAFWEGLATTNGSTNQDDAANAVYNAAISLGCTITELNAIHTSFTNAGYTLPAVGLPVEFKSFTVAAQNKTILLNWTTAAEINNDLYEIERSTDGKNFITIGSVKSKGNSQQIQSYQFIDPSPLNGINYYRLKQIDLDGLFDYSNIQSVEFRKEEDFKLFYNDQNQKLQFSAFINEPINSDLIIYNTNGQQLVSVIVDWQRGFNQKEMAIGQLSAGIYIAKIQLGQRDISKKFFVK